MNRDMNGRSRRDDYVPADGRLGGRAASQRSMGADGDLVRRKTKKEREDERREREAAERDEAWLQSVRERREDEERRRRSNAPPPGRYVRDGYGGRY